MKIQIFLKTALAVLLAAMLAGGCSKKNPGPEWKFGEEAIHLTYRAALNLNEVNDGPHSLLMVIYQLKEVNEFNRFAGYREGLKKLLEAKIFDPSVMAMEKVFIEPGGARALRLNRAEGARYVGIVAGYYDLIPSRCTALMDIEYGAKKTGLFKIWKEYEVNKLSMNLVLGRDSVRLTRAKYEEDDDS